MSLKSVTLVDRHIGRCIRLQRINLGMSQEALGDHLGLTFQQIQKYERGINRVSAKRLYDLARILQVEISFFYEGIPEEKEAEQITGMEEGMPAEEYLDFVSSHEGVQLNKSFTRIRDKEIRQRIIDMARAIELSQPKRRRRKS